MEKLEYKPNAEAIVQRLTELWSRKAQDRIFAHLRVRSPALEEFAATYTDGPCEYPEPEERIAFWDRCLEPERHVEDDWMPIAYLSEFDEGLCASLCGGTMEFLMHSDIGWISSMCKPCLDDLAKIDELKIDPEHPSIQRLDRQLKVFAEGARGKFGIAPYIVIDALNFVAEVRGMTQAFIDVLDSPEEVKRLMQFAYELNVFTQERTYSALDGFAGGSFVNMGSWAPGRPVLFSVDAYHMAKPDFFEEWGRPYIQPLLDHFDGGLLHLHSNGRHLLESVRTMPGLLCIYLLDEPWNPRAYDRLEEMKEKAGDVPVVVNCGWNEFCRDLDRRRLPGNVLYQVSDVPSAKEANRVMENVRAYRNDA
jgi:hypothetical protein